jgi:autotransporter-associated beta strand protein
MKLKNGLTLNSLACITFAGFFTHGAALVSAATGTWTGASGGDWDVAGNWNVKPVAGDTAVISTSLAAVANAVADQSILNIQFDGAAGTASGTMTVGTTAGNSLIVGNGGATEILSSLTGTAKVISIDAPVVLSPASTTADGTYSLTNNSADATNGLQFKGTIQASATTGTETLVLNGSNTGASNVIHGALANGAANALAVHKTGAGKWTISSSSNPVNNSYSGGTTISGGTLEVYSSYTQYTLGAGLLTFDGGTLLGTGYAPILFNDVVVNNVSGNAVITTADLQLRGNITGSGTLTHHLDSFASLGLYGDNSGFTGTYVQDANGSYGWTYFYNAAAGSPNAAWVINNQGLAGDVTGGTTVHLGSLASTNYWVVIGNHGGGAATGGGRTTFVIGENNATTTFCGMIRDLSGPYATADGTTAIVKAGSGTLWLRNIWNNNYSGGTRIDGGAMGSGNTDYWGSVFGTGPITLNGGTLLADHIHVDLTNNIIVNPVAGNEINLGVDPPHLTGNLSGSGDVKIIEESGAWTALMGDNSGYSGTITVDKSIYGNFSFGPSATSDAAAWVLNNDGVVGGNSDSVSQTLNFGSLAGTNPNTLLGDGYNSSTLVKIGARSTDADYAGKIVDAWYGSGTTRVTKVGTGIQTLSGALSYKGNTTIEDGTLSITTPNFDDASTVIIGTGVDSAACLDLPNAGTDIVASLVINGVAQETGKVYGNSSSVLPVIATSVIRGPGKIQVGASPATPYDTWAVTTYGLQNPWLGVDPALNGEPTADPDHDGLTNQQEFAFGLSPISSSSVNPILAQLNKLTGTFTYQRRASSGLAYKILTSTNLTSWAEDTGAAQSAGAVDGNGNQAVVVTLSGTTPLSDSKKFVRVAAQ